MMVSAEATGVVVKDLMLIAATTTAVTTAMATVMVTMTAATVTAATTTATASVAVPKRQWGKKQQSTKS